MRFVVLAVSMAALVAVIIHFGGANDAFAQGVNRPFARLISMMAFFAVGLIGWRLGAGGLVAVMIGVVAGALLSAFLTGRGLDLPEMRIAGPLALVLAGAAASWPGSISSGAAVLIAALVGVTHGHLLSDGLTAAQDLSFLGGVGIGCAALALGGCLTGEAVSRVVSGLGERLGAALAGVGLYLMAGALGFH